MASLSLVSEERGADIRSLKREKFVRERMYLVNIRELTASTGWLFDVGGHKFKGRAVIMVVHFSPTVFSILEKFWSRNLDSTSSMFCQDRITEIIRNKQVREQLIIVTIRIG